MHAHPLEDAFDELRVAYLSNRGNPRSLAQALAGLGYSRLNASHTASELFSSGTATSAIHPLYREGARSGFVLGLQDDTQAYVGQKSAITADGVVPGSITRRIPDRPDPRVQRDAAVLGEVDADGTE